MPDAPSTQHRDIPATYRFDGEAFDKRCRELGATTETARADLLGVDRATIRRYRKGFTVPLLTDALDLARRLDLDVTDIWKEA